MPTKQKLSAHEQAQIDAGIQFGMNTLRSVPTSDKVALEMHITGVLVVFMGALWGTLGTEYARGFIEAQLHSMDANHPHDRFSLPSVQ